MAEFSILFDSSIVVVVEIVVVVVLVHLVGLGCSFTASLLDCNCWEERENSGSKSRTDLLYRDSTIC